MTNPKNSTLRIQWCECGRIFRGPDLNKHLKENEGSEHKKSFTLSACTEHKRCYPHADERFSKAHVLCRRVKVTDTSVKDFLNKMRQAYEAGERPPNEESFEERAEDEAERAVKAIEKGQLHEVLMDLSHSSMSDFDLTPVRTSTEADPEEAERARAQREEETATRRDEEEMETKRRKEDEATRREEEEAEAKRREETEAERRKEECASRGIRRQNYDHPQDLEKKLVNREQAMVQLMDRCERLRKENQVLLDKEAKNEAQLALNTNLRKEALSWHSAYQKELEQNGEMAKKIVALEAQVEKIRGVNVGQQEVVKKLEREKETAKSEKNEEVRKLRQQMDEEGRRAAEILTRRMATLQAELVQAKESLSSTEKKKGSIYMAHLGCFEGIPIGHPNVYDLRELDETILCPRDDSRHIRCHHLTFQVDEDGQPKIRVERMKMQSSRK